MTIRRADHAIQWLSEHWPEEGLDWPSDIPHPEPTPQPEQEAVQ